MTKDIPAFVAASEKLETSQYEMTNLFFFILEKEKMSFPPATVKPYEEFLGTTALPGSVTPNKDKRSPMLRARESMNSSSRRSGVASNLLLSPLKAIALSSPRSKSSRVSSGALFTTELDTGLEPTLPTVAPDLALTLDLDPWP